MHAWQEALEGKAMSFEPTYQEGFRAGWLDASINYESQIAKTSVWGLYATGYYDGQISRYDYEREVICLSPILR